MYARPSLLLALGLALLAVPSGLHAASVGDAPRAAGMPTAADSIRSETSDAERSLAELVRLEGRGFGYSGALRVAVARVLDVLELPFLRAEEGLDGVTYRWVPLFGTRPEPLSGEAKLEARVLAPSQPGAWRLLLRRGSEQYEVADLTVLTEVPFTEKRNGRLNGYKIGTYATEFSGRTDEYAPPAGFIEVTPANRDLQISQHFRLGQFLTKDQFNVWPKYVALDLRLIDKLELVVQELKIMGVRAERMHVMSGFRTPQYNGPGEGGRARLSRHTYGDAADVWIENGGTTGYMADLNGDGRRDERDALILLQAVERVEQKYPDLIGGAGVYAASSARGPFVHVDVRGQRSRW